MTDETAEGKTEDEAVEQLLQTLSPRFPGNQFVRVGPFSMRGKTGNPWLDYFGYAKDDPFYQEYLDEIKRHREEVDRQVW